MLDDEIPQSCVQMLTSSWPPTRDNSPAQQFRLRLKTDYQNVAEEMRVVEFGFVANFVEI